jgi:hypothetical protein
MDPLTAAALLASGALTGGGNYLGAKQAASAQPQTKNLPASVAYDPTRDAVLSAISAEGLLSLGYPIDGVLRQSSPLAALQNSLSANAAGMRQQDLTALQRAMVQIGAVIDQGYEAGLSPDQIAANLSQYSWTQTDGRGRLKQQPGRDVRAINFALAAGGYGSIQDLVAAEVQFRQQMEPLVARSRELQGVVQAGRDAALRGVSQLQQDFPITTESEIKRVTGDVRGRLVRDITEDVLQAANVGRFNPAAALGRGLENVDLNALNVAINLLGGRQQLGERGLTALQESLAQPTRTAQGTSQIRTGGAVSASQIAADQARALAGIGAQSDSDAANLRGTATSGLFGGIGQGLSDFALLRALGGPASRRTGSETSDDEFNEFLVNFMSRA